MLREETPYVDLIIKLLEDHDSYYQAFADPDPEIFPNTLEVKKLKKDIEKTLCPKTTSMSIGSLLKNAYVWWDKNGSRFPDQYLARKILLGVLNALVKNETVKRFIGTEKQLIIGRRFWDYYYELQNNGRTSLDKQHYSPARPFHRLHVVNLKQGEWRVLSKSALHKRKKISEENVIPLRVGLFSLSKSVKTWFEGTKVLDVDHENYGFISRYVAHHEGDEESVDGYLQELSRCVKWANEAKLHALILPELSVCPKGLEKLQMEIEKNPGNLCLVIPGSFHDQSAQHSGRYANAAPIWLVNEKKIEVLTSYEKHEPFSIDIKRIPEDSANLKDPLTKARENQCQYIKEDIGSGNQLRILSTSVGTITVFICKDFLFHENKRLNDALGFTDHLFVISMNFVGGPFDYMSWERSYFGTAIYYVNALQACAGGGEKSPEAAFWRFPCKVKGRNGKTFYLNPTEGGEQIDETGQVSVDEIAVPHKMFIK